MREQHGPWQTDRSVQRISSVQTQRLTGCTQRLPQRTQRTGPNPIPARSNRQMMQPQRNTLPTTEEIHVQHSFWPAVFLGMLGTAILLFVIPLCVTALTNTYNTARYGWPRISQYDFTVGHSGEDGTHKTHFIVVNNNRKILILEVHPDSNIVTGYDGPVLTQPGDENCPVFLELIGNPAHPDIKVSACTYYFFLKNSGKKYTFEKGLS